MKVGHETEMLLASDIEGFVGFAAAGVRDLWLCAAGVLLLLLLYCDGAHVLMALEDADADAWTEGLERCMLGL
jgi:hypothetical protein